MALLICWACAVVLFLWWFHTRSLPRQREIVGCRHTRGKLIEAVPDRYGSKTALIWQCDECPLQVPLRLYRYGRDEHGSLWLNPKDERIDAHRDTPRD